MTQVAISPYRATKYLDRAGNFWVYLQYALGLQAVGCDVWWLERLEEPGQGTRSGLQAPAHVQAELLAGTLERFGLRNPPLLYTEKEGAQDFDPAWVGLEPAAAERVIGTCELLLNFHQKIHPELLARFDRSALVDIDPGLLQYWISSGQLAVPPHDLYLTTGETVGTSRALFSDCGHDWIHIRPPVFLDEWPYSPETRDAAFTSVSSWYASEYIVEPDGSWWDNNKRVQWLELLGLPGRTGEALELATFFGEKDGHERDLLDRHGWTVRHAGEVAGTPESYRAYVQSSRGELSPAKPSCMRFQNAWISDRTLCYLASGKPAVVQDTGPSELIPFGEGIVRFSSADEAVAALAEVRADYARHARAARDIAESVFDARDVAREILEGALGSPAPA